MDWFGSSLRDGAASTPDAKNQEPLQTGVRERMLTGTCGSSATCSHPRKASRVGAQAHYFLREHHIEDDPMRFDLVAIDNRPRQPPVVRGHKSLRSAV